MFRLGDKDLAGYKLTVDGVPVDVLLVPVDVLLLTEEYLHLLHVPFS